MNKPESTKGQAVEITSKSYWEGYYKAASEDQATIEKICSFYDYFWDLLVKSCSSKPSTVLEIGAFPGRYLAYFSSRYNLHPTGIDFNPDQEKIARSMSAMGINQYEYEICNFLTHKPEKQYDVVFSNGFIEHFKNYDEVLDKHVAYLKPGGSLMIMIPNKRYFRQVYGYLVDYENLKAHNLECMHLDVFREFARRNSLSVKYLSYFGGFGFKVHQPLSWIQRPIYAVVRRLSIRFNKVISDHPSKWLSGTIIAVFSKT
jgi:2-polyprenyl-3-methyl-5-hydroxy-6-metoxy-1,4-benzoquinol methylase